MVHLTWQKTTVKLKLEKLVHIDQTITAFVFTGVKPCIIAACIEKEIILICMMLL